MKPGRPDNGHGPARRAGIDPDEIDGAFVPELRSSIASVELHGEAVLLDEVTGSLHVLNAMATLVHTCFDGAGTIDELVVDLAEAFGEDVDTVREDVVALARDLGRQGLLDGVIGENELPAEPVGDEDGT